MTGETLTEAVRTSLAERLRRERLKRGRPANLADELEAIVRRSDALPVRQSIRRQDHRSRREWPAVLMVIDSSALVAIMVGQPERRFLVEAIAATDTRLVGAPTMLETSMVVLSRTGIQLAVAARASNQRLALRERLVMIRPVGV